MIMHKAFERMQESERILKESEEKLKACFDIMEYKYLQHQIQQTKKTLEFNRITYFQFLNAENRRQTIIKGFDK